MEKMEVLIKGMHCRSCEMLIEDGLKGVAGIKRANVNHKKLEARRECNRAYFQREG